MNIVSGGKPTNTIKKGSYVASEQTPYAFIEDTGVVADFGVAVKVLTEMPSGPSLRDVKYAEMQRVTRIIAAKSLLKEELKKRILLSHRSLLSARRHTAKKVIRMEWIKQTRWSGRWDATWA